MKKYTMTAAAASVFWLSQVQAQELELVCNSDAVLSAYLVSELGDGQNTNAGSLSAAEISEIQSVLAGPLVANEPVKEKYKAVMTACSQGQILNSRFSPSSN